MNIKLNFDNEAFKKGLEHAVGEIVESSVDVMADAHEQVAALQSPRRATDTTLADVMRADQVDAEIESTAGRIGQFYERLRASGISEDAAAEITATYSAMLISQHFGVDVASTYGVGPIYDVED